MASALEHACSSTIYVVFLLIVNRVFLKIICEWRLLRLFRRNLVGNVSGLALHTMTLIKQTWTELCFCFRDNSTYRHFPTVRSYSLPLNCIIYIQFTDD